MNATEVRDRLFLLTGKGIKYDLDRMVVASARCGNPHLAYPCFHVAGTNGKGSTCAYIESALRHKGFRTGLYTSPHLIHFEERFRIDGESVDEQEWLEIYQDQEKIIDDLKLTFFEATTLMAFELFKRKKVDWAIFEVGLGGRLDATNIIRPIVSVIATIDMDHMEYLGNDILSIASEKLGIIKSNTPCVMINPSYPEVAQKAIQVCKDNSTSVSFVASTLAEDVQSDNYGNSFTWKNIRWHTPLPGEHQIVNCLLALNALKHAGISLTDSTIQEGIASVQLPGRFQMFTIGDKTVIFDVAHNPNASEALVAAIKSHFPQKSICFVTGIMGDKDSSGVLENFSKIASHLIFTTPNTSRAAQAQRLLSELPYTYKGTKEIVSKIPDAVQVALKNQCEVICITGSFYTVGEAMESLGIS